MITWHLHRITNDIYEIPIDRIRASILFSLN